MKIARSIKSPQRIVFRFFHTNRQVKIRTLKTEGCGTRPPPPSVMSNNLMVYSDWTRRKSNAPAQGIAFRFFHTNRQVKIRTLKNRRVRHPHIHPEKLRVTTSL
jgi:hypothetical protein